LFGGFRYNDHVAEVGLQLGVGGELDRLPPPRLDVVAPRGAGRVCLILSVRASTQWMTGRSPQVMARLRRDNLTDEDCGPVLSAGDHAGGFGPVRASVAGASLNPMAKPERGLHSSLVPHMCHTAGRRARASGAVGCRRALDLRNVWCQGQT
jgi:hypothetical protein